MLCVFIAAQFWNIPISPVERGNNTYLELFDDDNTRHRVVPADKELRTWDHTRTTCYYVGNSQGGPSQSHSPRESVIEGTLPLYETTSLFSPSFSFVKFDESACVSGGGSV